MYPELPYRSFTVNGVRFITHAFLFFSSKRALRAEHGIDLRLQELLCDVCQQKEITLIKVHVESDLVDLVIELPPQHGVHNAVKQMKRYLSHCLRQEFPALKSRLPTLWSNAYFITTCGRMGKNYYEMMQDFLQRQKSCKNNGKKKQP